jgi:hypothetical protein
VVAVRTVSQDASTVKGDRASKQEVPLGSSWKNGLRESEARRERLWGHDQRCRVA